MENPPGEMDQRLLKHFEMAKLYEHSEFAQRYINRDLLLSNPLISELQNLSERYQIGEEIGRGGMKRISRAVDLFTNRTVALATIKSIESEEDIDNFLREARLTASLQHQNIIPVYDLGIDTTNRPYFTMKLIEGENLNDIIKKIREGNRGYRGKYKLRALLDIFLKVCDAVAYAHSQNIVHLDLKPHNIQIGDHGEVLLCDWGIARRLEERQTNNFASSKLNSLDDRESTLDTFIKGTPGYMSPEQASGHFKDTGKKTDIYSLGAILYTILTLEVPFESDSVENMIDDTVNGNIIVPSYLTPDRDIPDALEKICLKCMEVDKVSRYVSVRKLAEDIRAWEEGFVTSVEDLTLRGQFRLFYKRNKKACYLGILGLAASFTIISLFLILLYRSADRAEKARLQAQETLDNLVQMEEEKKKLSKDASFRVYSKALEAVKNGNLEEAREPLSYALDLNPELKPAWVLSCQLKLLEGDYKEALKSALKANNSDLVNGIQALSRDSPDFSSDTINLLLEYAQNNRETWWVDYLIKKIDSLSEKQKLPVVLAMLKRDNNMVNLNCLYEFDAGGRLSLHLSHNKSLEDISALEHIKIHKLNLSETSVSKLKPITGQPLEELNLFHTNIRGIKAVAGMPLKKLSIEGSSFTDLSPLKGSPIERIELGRGRINLKFLNSLTNLKVIELPQGLFTEDDLKVLRPGIKVTYRDFHIHKGSKKKK